MGEIFALDDKNEQLKAQYRQNNYKVIERSESGLCYIFCSSNGIYDPDSEFYQTVVVRDRYEWGHIAGSVEVQNKAARIIFIRDIYKSFYVEGINTEINSVDRLCSFLKEKTQGMKVVTCGISTGGYIATIIGLYLGAERVYNFGGQWIIRKEIIEQYPMLRKHEKDSAYTRYYDIRSLVEGDHDTPIFYFYSALHGNDKKQVELLQETNYRGVYIFAMKSEIHGWLLYDSCYRHLLTMEKEQIIDVCDRYRSKLISQDQICFDLMDKRTACAAVVQDLVRRHQSLQWLQKRFGMKQGKEK